MNEETFKVDSTLGFEKGRSTIIGGDIYLVTAIDEDKSEITALLIYQQVKEGNLPSAWDNKLGGSSMGKSFSPRPVIDDYLMKTVCQSASPMYDRKQDYMYETVCCNPPGPKQPATWKSKLKRLRERLGYKICLFAMKISGIDYCEER